MTMKRLQILLACLILIGQVVVSYAAEPEVITAPEGGSTNWGHSVDVSGTTLIAGYTSYVGDAGGVFILERKGRTWGLLQHFQTPNADRDWYGHAVALDGNLAVVSAYEHGGKKPVAGICCGEGPGRVYVYQRGGRGDFVEMATFKAADVQNNDRFGYSVDISGTTLIAGAPMHDGQKGAVYVYGLDGNAWKEQAKLVADDASERNRFGWDCAISENTIVVGAPLAAAPDRLSGAAYIFKRQGDAWAQVAKLTPEDGDGGDSFGAAVDVSKSRVIVGATKDENEAKERGSGSAYIFSGVGDVWT
ncbi:MAG: FG-GAP repeat protein, partial [Candidatus Poribacteria bacterium]|nr:FG-GAP repeat protein [Candidatus Poribacteria bacterium]